MIETIKRYFWCIWHELKYIGEELYIKMKHPTRNGELWYHCQKLWYDIVHPFYRLRIGIRNLFVWFKIVWFNEPWDNSFMLNMIDKQLSEMERFWHSDKPHAMAQPHIAKRITWTRKLLKMHIDEYYSMAWFDKFHDARGGFREWESVACAWDEYGIPTMYKMSDNMSEEDKKKYREGSAKSYQMDDKVWKLFIKGMSKARVWWD